MTQHGAPRAAWWVVVLALTAATMMAAALGGWQMLAKNRQLPPVAGPALVAGQPAAREAVLKVAKTNVAKILTYTPQNVEEVASAAERLLTGEFLSYYRKFTGQTVVPTAQREGISTTATVSGAGVESLTSQRASILAFVDQSTTTRDQPSPKRATSSVRVGLTKVQGTWLIDSFKPT
ncbi:hypothetical protein [Mycobacterium ulcerans]|uniref:hypothetical protein n=1 Tax=Mycobacterium ulcerans TaxID=1809 RepID=UPI000BBA8348|nr:hypothetical protein [Mycobacterium ulcerans]